MPITRYKPEQIVNLLRQIEVARRTESQPASLQGSRKHCFFFPSHEYLKRAKHSLLEYAILVAGNGFCLIYMLALPVMVLGKSPLLVAGAFLLVHLIIGLTITLVFQSTHTIDSTYFPSGRGEFDNGVHHIFATMADYATENLLVGWLAGGLNNHIVHHGLNPYRSDPAGVYQEANRDMTALPRFRLVLRRIGLGWRSRY